jgi:hypothetical protein
MGRLIELKNDLALRTALGRAGHERVEREFDWEVKVDRMLAIYRRVAARSAERAGDRQRRRVQVSQPEGSQADI